MQCGYLAQKSETPLLYRHWPRDPAAQARAGGHVFLGHSQPTHSGHVTDLATAFHRAGWTVHAGDILGHGRSTAPGEHPGHLDGAAGWLKAIASQRALFEAAFDGVAWEDRLVVAPNIAGLLTLEVLKDWPDLARDIVLISPPPNQRALARFGLAFSRARVLLRGETAPDPHSLHHLYSFLGAHLGHKAEPGDVMSSDREAVRRVVDDPLGWPTPTAGYWVSIFSGMLSAWRWSPRQEVWPGTRCLVLYGAEDAMLRDGGFLEPVRRTLEGAGFASVSAQKVEGGRSALFLDEARLRICDRILAWHQGGELAARPEQQTTLPQVAREIFDGIQLDHDSPEQAYQSMLQLCYEAVENEQRWTEMLYSMIAEIDENSDLDDAALQDRLNKLMPHWDRAFQLNRQVMLSSSFGLYLSAATDRLGIGVAVLDRDNRPLQNNAAFLGAIAALVPQVGGNAEPAEALERAIRALLADQQCAPLASERGSERVICVDNRPVGLQMVPRGGGMPDSEVLGLRSLLILRHPDDAQVSTDHRKALLALAYELTPKEAEVALQVARGLSVPEIAEALAVAPSTVRSHLKIVFDKLGVHSQNELTARILSGPVGWRT